MDEEFEFLSATTNITISICKFSWTSIYYMQYLFLILKKLPSSSIIEGLTLNIIDKRELAIADTNIFSKNRILYILHTIYSKR